MREYLERIFPVISHEENETATERTWHLYDTINFMEFCVFLLLRTILGTIFTIAFGLVKFGIVLLLTYGFALGVFYYFDQYMPEEKKQESSTKLKRPSEFGAWKENSSHTVSNLTLKRPSNLAGWKENGSKTQSPIASLLSKLEEKSKKTLISSEKSATLLQREVSLSEKDENNKKLYPDLASHASELTEHDNISTLKIEKSPFPPRPLDDDSDLISEEVVRVGSFRRSTDENGKQSIVSKALADLENISTKTNSKENKPETLSITKSDVRAVKSSNA